MLPSLLLALFPKLLTMLKKVTIDETDFIKIKAFSTSKDTINEVKWQATRCKKTFTAHVSDK